MGFLDGDYDLETDLLDRRPIPPGENEKKFNTALRMNRLGTACNELRAAVPGSTSLESDPFPSGQMSVDKIHNYTDANIATHTVLYWKGADNQGTTITGMDATGVSAGAVRFFVNPSNSGIDVGTVTLNHEDTGSLAANRFCLPGCAQYQVPVHGVTIVVRGVNESGAARWLVVGQNGHAKKALIQALHLYPNLQVGTVASPVSGSLNNYNPTGPAIFESSPGVPSTLGIAGSNLTGKDHTFWRMFVDAAGATLTGIYGTDTNAEVQDFGRLHVIKNYGPGTLTIAHRSGSSSAHNQIFCPNQRDLKVPADGAVWLVRPFLGSPDPGVTVSWHVIGFAASNEVFPSVTTTGRTTTQTLSVGPQLSPSALAAGLTSNYNPGSHAVINVAGTSPSSRIDGIVPNDVTNGEIRIVRNSGAVPIVLVDALSSASSAANQIALPSGNIGGVASCYVILPNQEIAIQYNPATSLWTLLGGTAFSTFNTATSITPTALPGSSVNDYSPTDASSGLQGRFAYWWFVQGQVGTELTGIKSDPTGLPPFRKGDRVLLTNLGGGMTIKNGSGSSAAGNRFLLVSDIILSANGSHEFIYNGSVWMSTSFQ